MREWQKFILVIAGFLGCYFLPVAYLPIGGPVYEALALVKWYAREHVLLCLVPALFIAGAIGVFVSQASVIKYFGASANKFLSYSVAAVSGAVLAVCSCTVLPLFTGIYKRGSGLGPAIAFLYSGPAINVLAIILTARVLGWQLGVARAAGAVGFSIVIGLVMHFLFLAEEKERHAAGDFAACASEEQRPLWKTAAYFFAMTGILVFANWAKPVDGTASLWAVIYAAKWYITAGFGVALAYMIAVWFIRAELQDWMQATWGFALQILPLLLGGVLISGFLLGRVGHEGIIPSRYITALVGGNSLFANFFSSVVGAFMYFATLTEVPIVQGLMGAGMGKGPALALLLSGPALSLPSMLVIRSVLGTKKTVAYVALVIIFSTVAGMIFGAFA